MAARRAGATSGEMDTPLPMIAAPAAAPWPSERVRVGLSLLALYAIWSSTYLALRVVVVALPALLSAGARYVVAGAVLLAVVRARGARFPTRREWLAATPIGALLFLCGNGFVALAERTVASSVAAVACATTPLWAALLGRFFGKRVSSREAIGLAVGFVGVAALCWGDGLRGDRWTLALLLAAPFGWALGSILSQRLPVAPGLGAAATEMITGGAAMAAVGALTGERLPTHVPASAALALAYLVVFGSLVAFSAYSYLLRVTRTSVAMSYAYVNPALAVLLGAGVAGESIGVGTIVATALVVAAVVLIARAKRAAA